MALAATRSPSRATPFGLVACALFVLLLDGNLPTPLYGVYREEFGFSGTTLTLIFAVYAIALVPSLLVFGQLSDRVGRRPVIAGGLGVAAVGLLLLAVAESTAALLAARAVQGIALGAAVGTIPAALVELEPNGDHSRAATAAVLGQSGGSAAGPLLAGALAQWAPAPRQLCYAVGLVVTIAAIAGVLTIREPRPPSGRWRLQKPSVPAPIRAGFARASVTCAAVWAIGALFLSVVPSYAADLLDTTDLALLGAIAAVMLAMACLAQALSLRGAITPRRAQPLGLTLLIAGIAALVLAFPLHALALVLAAAVLAGTGLGLGYFGSQSEINRLAPPERRGEVTAAFITCVYLSVTVTAISTGLLSDALSLASAVAIAGTVVAVVAVAATAWHVTASPWPGGRRARPSPRR
jgi:MFS family permease